MKPPPPTPHENGSVTPSTAAAATAASIAFPPPARMSIAACEASRSTDAAAPPVPVEVGGSDAARVGADAAIAAATSAASVAASTKWKSRDERMRDPFRWVPRHPRTPRPRTAMRSGFGFGSLRDGELAPGGVESADASLGAGRLGELLAQHRERHLVAPRLAGPPRREPAPQCRLLDEAELARDADARHVLGIDVDVDAVDVAERERDARQRGRQLGRVPPPDGRRRYPVVDLEPAVPDPRVEARSADHLGLVER